MIKKCYLQRCIAHYKNATRPLNIKDIHAIYQYFQERYITFIFAQGSQKLSATVKMQSPFFYENLNNQTLIAYTFLAP